MKKLLSIMICTVMLITTVATPLSASAASTADSASASTKTDTDVNVGATNSFGNMLADTLEESTDSDSGNREYVITDVIVKGNTASVSYCAVESCTVVVALYDEKSGEMLATGNADVQPEQTSIDVSIDTDKMPKTFTLKAFMLDGENNPLSAAYSSDMYTESIQYVKSLKASDFDSGKVLNLDEDETTNFAVYSDTTLVIPYTEGYNIPQEAMPENGVYVFTNANDDFKTLKAGDIISYTYGSDVLLIKVASVNAEGDTVTITNSDDASIKTFFDYVKIESDASMDDAEYDGTNADEGVDFEGFVNENDRQAGGLHSSGLVDYDGKATVAASFVLDKSKNEVSDGKITLKSNLRFAASVSLQLYLGLDNCEIKFGVDTNTSLTGSIIAQTDNFFDVPLGCLKLVPIPGVCIDFTPKFVSYFKATATFSLEVSKHSGFSASFDSGICDTSTPDKTSLNYKCTGEVFIGVDLGPELSVLFGVAEFDLTLQIGGKIVFSPVSGDLLDDSCKHLCNECQSGEMKLCIVFYAEISILDFDILPLMLEASYEKKIFDFYYSADNNEWEFGTCPHYAYRTTVTVKENGVPKQNEPVYCKLNGKYEELGTTDSNGQIIVYLEMGLYYFRVGNLTRAVKIKIKNAVSDVSLDIASQSSDSDTDSSTDSDVNNAETHNDERTALIDGGECGADGDNVMWELYESGTLYVFGEGSMKDYGNNEKVPWNQYRDDITRIVIEPGVVCIGDYAFRSCKNVISAIIPNGVKTIQRSSFEECVNLSDIIIPNSVTTIEYFAFASCSSLTSVEISDNVTNFGDGVFFNCDSLMEITVDKNNKNYTSQDGVLFNKSKTMLIRCPEGKSGEYIIPTSVKVVGKWAFEGCSNLTKITVPYGVQILRDSAFSYCRSLTDINIPASVTSIGSSAFSNCSSLTDITVPYGVEGLGSFTFYGCTSLTHISLPDSLTTIGSIAFRECTSLTSIKIPESVTKIENSAFYGCSSLTEIIIPDSVVSIGMSAFDKCTNLQSVVLSNSIDVIEGYTFNDCSSLRSITIPASVKEIRKYAFIGCTRLTSVYFLGDKPRTISGGQPFIALHITIYYPAGNETWKNTKPSSFSVYAKFVPYYPASGTAMPTPNSDSSSIKNNSVSSFTDLTPNGYYILMIVRSENAEKLYASDNLVYINQFSADENGRAEINYPIGDVPGQSILIFGGKDVIKIPVDDPDIPDNPDTPDTPDTPDNPDTDDDTKPLMGDINGDGAVTVKDASMVQQYVLEILKFTDVQKSLADMNGDGRISLKDASVIQRKTLSVYTNR